MITYETISQTVTRIDDFCRAVVQCRIPPATFIFLMTTNAIFWYCVFYLEYLYKLTILAGICITFFSVSFLKPTVKSEFKTQGVISSFKEAYGEFQRLPTSQQLVYLTVNGAVLPFTTVLVPALRLILWLLVEKFFELFVILISGASCIQLHQGENEQACWMAYLLFLFMLSAPPWRHNHVTEQINEYLYSVWIRTSNNLEQSILVPSRIKFNKIMNVLAYYSLGYWVPGLLALLNNYWITLKSIVQQAVIFPVKSFLLTFKYSLEYVFCGYWIVPLKVYLYTKMTSFNMYMNRTIVDPVKAWMISTFGIMKYCLLGYWIPPLVDRMKQSCHHFMISIRRNIIDPVLLRYIRCKVFTVYWLGGYWITPLIEYCDELKHRSIRKFQTTFVQPIVALFSNFTENIIYVLTGQWIPGFIQLINNKIYQPTVSTIGKMVDLMVYIAYGYWIRDLISYAALKRIQMKDLIYIKLIGPTQLWLVNSKKNIEVWAYDQAIRLRLRIVDAFINLRNVMIKLISNWFIASKSKVGLYKRHLFNDYLIPLKFSSRRSLIKAKLYLKYKILLPAIKNLLLGTIYSIEFVCCSVLAPMFDLALQQLCNLLQLFMESYGRDGWNWFMEHLPEKSPFVDVSDTELRDFLPSTNPTDSDEEHTVGRAAPEKQDRTIDDSAFSSSDDEEFSRDLQIPALEHADSDEEQESAFEPKIQSKGKWSRDNPETPKNVHMASVSNIQQIVQPVMSTYNVWPDQLLNSWTKLWQVVVCVCCTYFMLCYALTWCLRRISCSKGLLNHLTLMPNSCGQLFLRAFSLFDTFLTKIYKFRKIVFLLGNAICVVGFGLFLIAPVIMVTRKNGVVSYDIFTMGIIGCLLFFAGGFLSLCASLAKDNLKNRKFTESNENL